MDDRRLLSGKDVYKRYGLTVAWQRKRRHLGDGPPYLKIGKMVHYRVEDIERWLSERLVAGDERGGNNEIHL
jgi:predicted DNA-binding transcriptional regulator AlpA